MDGASLLDERSLVLGAVSTLNQVGTSQIAKQEGRPERNIPSVKKTTTWKVVKFILVHNAQGSTMIVSTQQKKVQFFSLLVMVLASCIR